MLLPHYLFGDYMLHSQAPTPSRTVGLPLLCARSKISSTDVREAMGGFCHSSHVCGQVL
jgi:hypothetical protein